jgi:hypothetical protein
MVGLVVRVEHRLLVARQSLVLAAAVAALAPSERQVLVVRGVAEVELLLEMQILAQQILAVAEVGQMVKGRREQAEQAARV